MASKRNMRRRGCVGKRKHPSKQAASVEAYKIKKKSMSVLCVYKCTECGCFHVGRMQLRKRKNIRK